ncbi:NAD(P)/FAD-dependent oxidoreductase [Candidatus Margulisiibacteriota bacterium]
MKYLIEQLKIPVENFIPPEIYLKKLIPNIKSIKILKKAIDARHKQNIKFIYNILFTTDKNIPIKTLTELKNQFSINEHNITLNNSYDALFSKSFNKKPPIIIGFGPAGIFAALKLLEHGVIPQVFERGKAVEERVKDVNDFWQTGNLNPKSNVLFGEGGAGTFSDGKLTTQINNPLNIWVKEKLVEFGAPPEILYEAKPHIGSDKLQKVLLNIRKHCQEKGVTFHFNSKLTDIIIHNNSITEIVINDKEIHKCTNLFLAIGHSAHDTYEMLYKKGLDLEPKPFAIGFRIEHAQELINQIQYGDKFKNNPLLGPASYKLTYRATNGRSVFTFCMCPGGQIICSSNQPNRLVINGMSNFERNSGKANSAIVVGVTPDDYLKGSPLDGVTYIKHFEEQAFLLSEKPFFAPTQFAKDFIAKKASRNQKNLHSIFPNYINSAISEALLSFENKMKGFLSSNPILFGVETRTSSPVRIPRNENREHIRIQGLYPIGEGSGQAGGIMSSALDGINSVLALTRKTYSNPD